MRRLFGREVVQQHADRLSAWKALRPPRLDQPLSRLRCVVVDVETAGLDPKRDALIAIGAVAVRDGRIILADSLELVLRQDAPSARENILIHGIGGTAQRGGSDPGGALMRFLEFIGSDPLIAFHAVFDATALRGALRRELGAKLRAQWLDLAYLLPALFPEHARRVRSLDEWLATFGIEIGQRHNAAADALATAQLLLIALQRAEGHGKTDYRSLRRLEKAQHYTRYQSAATG